MGNFSSNTKLSNETCNISCCQNDNGNGSLRCLTEKLAFPDLLANQQHKSTELEQANNVNYAFIKPINKKYNFILIFCHGNAMTITTSFCSQMSQLANFLNIEICLVEYPGYGESKNLGRPTANTCVGALGKMVDYFNSKGYDYKNIILVGHSIGTGVIMNYVYQNRDKKFGGIILLAPYKSIIKVVTDTSMNSSLTSFDFFKNEEIIEKIDAKICIIHGAVDEVINSKHSRELYEKIKKKDSAELHILNGIDHTNILFNQKCWKKMKDFIEKL